MCHLCRSILSHKFNWIPFVGDLFVMTGAPPVAVNTTTTYDGWLNMQNSVSFMQLILFQSINWYTFLYVRLISSSFFLNGIFLFIQSKLNCQISISSSCYFELIWIIYFKIIQFFYDNLLWNYSKHVLVQ